MTRLLLLILLLTVVYSWEELKYVVVVIWSKISKQKTNYKANYETDTLVSDLVLIASIPLSLAYLILGSQDLPLKLLIILGELLLIGLILKGLEEYSWRKNFTKDYQGADKIIAIIFSLAGLVSPSVRFANSAIRSTTRTGKYLIALALPLAAGLTLTLAVRSLGMEEFITRLDALIVIATLGLMLNVTIEIMEHLFRTNRWHLGSLMRVALGVVIIFVITASY